MDRIRNYVVLDLEMTGLDAKKNKVIEIGAVRIRDGAEADTYSCLVNPGIRIPEDVVRLTGITDEMAAGGLETDAAMQGLLDFMGEDLLVGQNVGFDYSFLAQWCVNRRIKTEILSLDTLKIARRLLPAAQSKKLEALCDYFKIERVNAHRAADDARETWQVFEKLQDLVMKDEKEHADLLTPVPLHYRAKRQTPATARQLEKLKSYMQLHGITEEVPWETITRSEASRLQDHYYARYGR